MTTPPRIRWQPTLLVGPASQQHLSDRVEALVQQVPGRYQPNFWGLTEPAEYDEAALHDGVLAVRNLDVVLRNGCHVSLEPPATLRLPLAIEDGASAIVSVGIDGEAATFRRFVEEGATHPTLVVGEDGVELPLVTPRLVLFTHGAPSDRIAATAIPLCEIERQGNAYRLTDRLPPLLQVAPTSPLAQRCRAAVTALRTEALAINDPGRLNALTMALPPLEALIEARPHPFTLYLELCRLLGAVAVFRHAGLPPPVAPYDHDAAHAGFERLLRQIEARPAAAPAAGAFRRFTFDREGQWFRLRHASEWAGALSAGPEVEVVLAIESADVAAAQWGEQCVIAGASQAERLLARRLLGCARRRLAAADWLPTDAHVTYFRVTLDPDVLPRGEDLLVIGHLRGMEPLALHLLVHEEQREGQRV